MKKAFDQTVRDLKRGVNKKVLKVPSIEQKVLDATSNEPWGPHGTLLAEIAQATRNYHEYQMIMSVLWKRSNDTRKNWRHVNKALTVLEYLVAHGSERVIDDIREHAHQIQTLSDFQYIDSRGRDQGSNVRKKSQVLVVLLNDKERIQEVREKAASNREKFRNIPAGGMYLPGSYSGSGGHGDDHYRSRGDERNDNGRGREYGYGDDDRYTYGHDGDRYGREYAERYVGDDDYRGRSRSVDNRSSRGRSSDRDKYKDDDQYSSRGSIAKADEQSQDGRTIYPKFSDQNFDAPPSYEEVVSGAETTGARHSPNYSGSTAAPAPNAPAVPAMNENGAGGFDEFDSRGSYSDYSLEWVTPEKIGDSSISGHLILDENSLSKGGNLMSLLVNFNCSVHPAFLDIGNMRVKILGQRKTEQDLFSLFCKILCLSLSTSLVFLLFLFWVEDDVCAVDNGRIMAKWCSSQHSLSCCGRDISLYDILEVLFISHMSAASTTSSGAVPTMTVGGEMDFLLSSSESFTGNLLVSMTTSVTSSSEVDSLRNSLSTFTPTDAPSVHSQGFGNPFGDGPFKAIPSQNGAAGQHQGFGSNSFQSPLNEGPELLQQVSQGAAEWSFSGTTSTPFGESSTQYQQQEFSTHDPSIDILADILPPTGPQPHVHSETGYVTPVSQAVPHSDFLPQTDQNVSPVTFSSPSDPTAQQIGFAAQSGQPAAPTSFADQPGQLVVHLDFPTQFAQPAPQSGLGVHGGQLSSLNGYANQAAQAPQTRFTFQMNHSQHGSFQSPGFQAAAPNPVPYGNYNMQPGYGAPAGQTTVPQVSAGSTLQLNATNFSVESQMPSATGQVGSSAMVASQAGLPSTSSTSSTAPPSKRKQFATKSTVWTDTLSRGLVNLDISGVKTNPLSDIGIDFDAINRKEKRMEKPTTTPVTSTLHMGKAMGSGSGMGRAGAVAIRPPPNSMMGTGINTGMMGMDIGGPRPGVGMGGYGGMNQQAMGAGMGMNMNMGGQMQLVMGFPPISNFQGGYSPMIGAGNYGQSSYGGGY
ncbi:hypothetical protein Leryth_009664 [Lithospermum erythrorhizon]|nr:hypothetical protein Leryth_009664 [Lithospermum erythrorhizon]